jgi:hypothetical protein
MGNRTRLPDMLAGWRTQAEAEAAIGRTSFQSCRQGRNEDGVVIPSALAPIADAKAVRCRAAANDVKGQQRKWAA